MSTCAREALECEYLGARVSAKKGSLAALAHRMLKLLSVVLVSEQQSSRVWVQALKSQCISANILARVPESEHLGA